jgi:hypothetical protein
MNTIIDVEPKEAKEWLQHNPDWDFCGEVNTISHKEIVSFVDALYKAGCLSILITEYEWQIEPVYEGDEFHPDMLNIKLPFKEQNRQEVFVILNTSLPHQKAKITYKDEGEEWIWYSFEPKPQKITVGGKEITWYS